MAPGVHLESNLESRQKVPLDCHGQIKHEHQIAIVESRLKVRVMYQPVDPPCAMVEDARHEAAAVAAASEPSGLDLLAYRRAPPPSPQYTQH